MHPEVLKTFEKMTEHLQTNDVRLADIPLTSGPVLNVDPATETFIDHAEANRLLTRNYRKPFVVPSEKEI
jgi:hypothetical protein